jgi:hypothetical protein
MLKERVLNVSSRNPNPRKTKLIEALKAMRPGNGKPYDGTVLSVMNNWSRPEVKPNRSCARVIKPIIVPENDNIKYAARA